MKRASLAALILIPAVSYASDFTGLFSYMSVLFVLAPLAVVNVIVLGNSRGSLGRSFLFLLSLVWLAPLWLGVFDAHWKRGFESNWPSAVNLVCAAVFLLLNTWRLSKRNSPAGGRDGS